MPCDARAATGVGMDAPNIRAHVLGDAVSALVYRARFPLRGPRVSTLHRAHSLAASDRADADDPVSEEDFALMDREVRGSSRFLGIYSERGLLAAMRAHGLLDLLDARGFTRIGVAFDLSDAFEHRLTVFDGDPSRRVGEVVAARLKVDRLGEVDLPHGSEVISIGWLAIENPDTREGAAAPGQERPGLGLARAVIDMSLAGATHMGFAAVLAVPAHYHLAWMYHPWYRPLDPREEGALLALREATRRLSRIEASWAINRGEVLRDGVPWRWVPPRMCAPIDASLRAWMSSAEYAHGVVEGASAARFELSTR